MGYWPFWVLCHDKEILSLQGFPSPVSRQGFLCHYRVSGREHDTTLARTASVCAWWDVHVTAVQHVKHSLLVLCRDNAFLCHNMVPKHAGCVKPGKNSIFLKKGKTVFSVQIGNFLDLG